MKLSSDASVLCLTHEVITNFAPLSNFDEKSVHNFPNICKNSIPDIEEEATKNIAAETFFSGVSVSSISVSKMIESINATKH